MELHQLEYFVAVAEEASFTRAAQRIHVAQPGVSAQIGRLERELGQQLFDRSGRRVRLTEVGAAVLPYARAALGAVAGARLAVDELTGLVHGRVAVGMVTACSTPALFDLLADFHRMHPAVEISLSEANSDRLIDGLRDGSLDLALIGTGGAPAAGLVTRVLLDEPLVAAVRSDDPLAARETVTLRALQERPLICLSPGTGLRTCIDDAFSAAGLRPRIALEASDPGVLAVLAARALGVAILPASLAMAHSAELHTVAITRPALRARIELAWRPDGPASPAARALIRLAQSDPEGAGSEGAGS
jgi:DNA-binding transcriptional LysR family regulator